MNEHTPEASTLLGTSCEWMTVLISLPSRGGIQPALLQTNFANHILWLKIGLLHPSRFGDRTSLVVPLLSWDKGWFFFLELKWQHILPQINFKLPMFLSFNQDDKNSTDNFLHCSFNFFFFFLETQKSRLALDIYCLTYRSITPSILAWTVYHCTLNSF